jgi:hypothetical protein
MEDGFDVKQAIQEIIEYQKHLAEEITEIKTSIMEELINPVKEEYNKMQYDNALSDFRCKYAEKLEPFGDKLKSIEGDDFDVVKKTFDDFMEDNKGYEEAEYVDEKAKLISDQLDKIGKAFGIEPEKIEEVKVETEEGEVKAEVEEGEVTAVEGETETTEEVETEEPVVEGEKVETEEEEVPATEEENEPEVEEKKEESISDKIKRITH